MARQQHPKVFAETDWNAIKDDAGLKDDVIEGLLAEYIDGAASAVLARLRAEQPDFPLTGTDRLALARFMSA